MKQSKNMNLALEKFDKSSFYSLDDAVALMKDMKYSNFDESVDLAINLDVDPRHAEENIRVTTPLPHGTGKQVRVLVFAEGDAAVSAKEAGADFISDEEIVKNIEKGWQDFDVAIATPDQMSKIGMTGETLVFVCPRHRSAIQKLHGSLM